MDGIELIKVDYTNEEPTILASDLHEFLSKNTV